MTVIRILAVRAELMKTAWRDRRDEQGGVLDESGMIFIGFMAAIAIGGAVYALVTSIEGDIDVGSLWGG